MVHFNLPIIFLSSLLLLGCSSAGVIHSNDPSVKISQAYQLKSQSRPIPAQKLLQEALVIYQAENNKQGEARAYLGLGDLYKSQSYQSQADIFKRWNEYQSYADAASYYLKAGNIYEEKLDYWSLSRTYSAAGDANILDGRVKESCELYVKVEETFNVHKSTFTESQVTFTQKLLKEFHSAVEC
ncbi:MAG: tetratricopeptide (TPR) repeat protein [Pseudohongiellaceae bacterium]|jgi:tetratricopeptide (TPR) repeat protein